MKNLIVNLNERSYPIIIGSGLLAQTGELIEQLNKGKVLLVSNPTVLNLYGDKVLNSLQQAGLNVNVATIPDGEIYKNLQEASNVLDKAVCCGLERDSLIIALGGGVIGDLAGFVASIYMRGIDFIQIPTTLLAQVDSSVGGKVAVNHPCGKNLIGSFHQPRMVLIDIETLLTLDDSEYRSGLAEVVKYGVIYDRGFFAFMENNIDEINTLDNETLQELIYRACTIKADIVNQDEKEMGIRIILNLGHTFGHSLEKLSGYSLRHGEAVAIGSIAACYLSCQMGLMDTGVLENIQKIYKKLNLIPPYPDIDNSQVYEGMLNDKKVCQGDIRMVIPLNIGNYHVLSGVGREAVEEALAHTKVFCGSDYQ
ncbi:MAG TPA: 3-dehydroquinate synthase [Syntrophomonas sp.]|jgi:3-dehydroquinate synthase|nr:3-dehydroquinate synthase [Syntrophomonas sp.]HCF70496.1 3-dehydroquinate synthase [Syntrophomonas sp.]